MRCPFLALYIIGSCPALKSTALSLPGWISILTLAIIADASWDFEARFKWMLMVSHLPWTTLTTFCLLAITQSLVRSSNKWSHCSTRSPWNKQEIIHIQELPFISHWHKPFNDFPHQNIHIPSAWGPHMLCGIQWCCQSGYWLKYLQRHKHVTPRGNSRSPSCPDLWGRCTEPSAWSWPPPPCRQPSGWGRADALLVWNRSCGI